MTCDHEAQIRDLLTEREELLAEIRRLRMGNHPAGRALRAAAEAWDEGWAARAEYDSRRDVPLNWPDRNPYRAAPEAGGGATLALAEALTERDAEHEGGGGA